MTALANRDTTIEMREFWKGEMAKCMRDLQSEYDERLDIIRNDIESKYSFQVSPQVISLDTFLSDFISPPALHFPVSHSDIFI